MSREAWGDEGDVPERWEYTGMYQDFHSMAERWRVWRERYRDEMPNDEFIALAQRIDDALDNMSEQMKGPL